MGKMSMDLFFEVMERLTPQLRAGDLRGCESGAIEALLALPESPFHIAAEVSISNDPAEVAAHFDRFFRQEAGRFSIEAAYTEMNGFDINPDLWYCDLFAYELDGGLEDLEWLCDWQSEYAEPCTITGLEQLQNVYASEAYSEPANEDASYLSSIVVVAKFQRFMQRCAAEMADVRVPLYVTAHDFDYIARIIPGEK